MRYPPLFLTLLLAVIVPTFAGTPIAVPDLPAAVAAAVSDHLPGSEIVSAEADDDDGVAYFDLKVRHRDLLLEIEATPRGRIREIDLNRRFSGASSLSRSEVPVPIASLPAPVTATVTDFLPGAKIVSAAEDSTRKMRFYELGVKHRDLQLRVDVSDRGELLDIDTVKR
jgi:hypothetical protein